MSSNWNSINPFPNGVRKVTAGSNVTISGTLAEPVVNSGSSFGPTGPTGLQGVQGLTGPSGVQGVQGLTGATGVQGVQGVPGLTGATGVQGVQGVQELTGVQGVQGLTGLTGPTGAVGTNGAQGNIGPQGIQGTHGAAGAQGSTGPKGSDANAALWSQYPATQAVDFSSYDMSNVENLTSSGSVAITSGFNITLDAANNANVTCANLNLNPSSSINMNAPVAILNGRVLISASYKPASPLEWAGSPPTNLQDAMDRLTDVIFMFTGMTPIP